MIKFLQILKKIVQIILNSLFFVQIALMILVFLTATYWLFNLMGSSIFSFAEPIANTISDFVKLFYNQDVMMSGIYVDSSLLLFDFVAILVVLGITKSKYYINSLMDYIDSNVNKLKQTEEDKFNRKLKLETDAKIRRANSFAILVKLEVVDLLIDRRYGSDINTREIEPKLENAYKILFSSLKSVEGCTFARKDQKLVIMSNNFSIVDNVVHYLEQAVERIRKKFLEDKFKLDCYAAIDVFEATADLKGTILPSLELLIKLRHANQIICYGNFNIRYSLVSNTMYNTALLRGSYEINGGTDIFVLLKKN